MKEIERGFRKYNSLKDYSLDELYEAIDDNENMTSASLAGFCSEILKRQREEILNSDRNKWNGINE